MRRLLRSWDSWLIGLAVIALFGAVLYPFLAEDSQRTFDADSRNSSPFIQDNLWSTDTHDYAVWVAPDGMPHAARRSIDDNGDWEVVDLGALPGNPLDAPTVDDEHNVFAIAAGPDGHVHVIGNSHADELHYVRTSEPGRFDRWEAAEIAGPSDRVTYPRFVQRADGELLFVRRDGGSGDGDTVIDALDESGEWQHVGTAIDGRSSDENPYLNRLAYDAENDRLHAMFNWRGSPDVDTNNDIGYAVSDDGGRTWATIDGTDLGTTVRHEPRTTIVDFPDRGSGLINQGGLTLDAEGRPHGVFRMETDTSSQVLHVWHDGSRWHHERLDIRLDQRPALATDSDGTLWLIGVQQREIVAIDLLDPQRRHVHPDVRVSRGWSVVLDSRSMERDGTIRTMIPHEGRPRIIELEP